MPAVGQALLIFAGSSAPAMIRKLLRRFIAALFVCTAVSASAQFEPDADSTLIRSVYDAALTRGEAYDNLRSLCKDVGHRLSGSQGAEKAVAWAARLMEAAGLENVRLQPVTVPHWERGTPERCILLTTGDTLDVLALGGSVPTDGVREAEVVKFSSLNALDAAAEGSLSGKIAFLDQPMNPKLIDTFNAYGSCAGARVNGPSAAARKGAAAFIMRSVTLRADDFPHTGVLSYDRDTDSIPAFALSTNSAFRLSEAIRANGTARLSLYSDCRRLPDVLSHNVIGELRGTEFPEKVITVGGHLDSWDVGEGAHDDGAGVVQSLEVLRIFIELGIRPRHTLRCVFFMNEENGSRGAKTYAEYCLEAGETHLAAMESDRGGFAPRGFHVDGADRHIETLRLYLPLFEPYLVHVIKRGYGGVDINPLRAENVPLIGVVPDSQRYFDVHHSADDVFENVNKRELELGAAGMTSLIYLIDKYGFPDNEGARMEKVLR